MEFSKNRIKYENNVRISICNMKELCVGKSLSGSNAIRYDSEAYDIKQLLIMEKSRKKMGVFRDDGGVTFLSGEATYGKVLVRILKACPKKIHTAIETYVWIIG